MIEEKRMEREMTNLLSKRPLRHTPATLTRRKRSPHQPTSMVNVVAVSTQARCTTVEDGRVGKIRILAPVPVGLCTFEVALCLQCCLVGPEMDTRLSVRSNKRERSIYIENESGRRQVSQHTIYSIDANA